MIDKVGEIGSTGQMNVETVMSNELVKVEKLTRARCRAIEPRESYSLAREIHREAREVSPERSNWYFTTGPVSSVQDHIYSRLDSALLHIAARVVFGVFPGKKDVFT